MDEKSLGFFALQAFAAIFVIIDPLGNVMPFMTATSGFSEKQKRMLSWRCGAIATVVLIVFALFGTGILHVFNISFLALRIGGGLVLLVVALRILSGEHFGGSHEPGKQQDAKALSTGVVPLAIPLMAGPGAMTTVLVLIEKSQTVTQSIVVLLCIVVVCGIAATCFRFSVSLMKRIGQTWLTTSSCLAGLILAIIAIQFVLDGLREAFPSLTS